MEPWAEGLDSPGGLGSRHRLRRIAQAAARPVITLVEKGTELPFDVEHLRRVEYDLQLRPVVERTYH